MKNESVAQLFDVHKDATNLDSKQLQGMFRSFYNAPKTSNDLKESKGVFENKTASDAYSAVVQQGIEPPHIEKDMKMEPSKSDGGPTNIQHTNISNTFVNKDAREITNKDINNKNINEITKEDITHKNINEMSKEDINNINKVTNNDVDNISKKVSTAGDITNVTKNNISNQPFPVPPAIPPVKGSDIINSLADIKDNITNLTDIKNIDNITNLEKTIKGGTDISNITNVTEAGSKKGIEAVTSNMKEPDNKPINLDNKITHTSDNKETNLSKDLSVTLNNQDTKNSQLFNTFNDILQSTVKPAVEGALPLPSFAMGGITHGLSVAGERGPEAVVPLPDGRNIPVQVTPPALPQVETPPKATAADTNAHLNSGIAAAREKDGENIAATYNSANKVAGTVKTEMSKMPSAMSDAVHGGAGAGGAGSNLGSQGNVQSIGGQGEGSFNPIKEDQRQGADADFGGIRDPAYGLRIKAWERIRGGTAYVTTI